MSELECIEISQEEYDSILKNLDMERIDKEQNTVKLTEYRNKITIVFSKKENGEKVLKHTIVDNHQKQQMKHKFYMYPVMIDDVNKMPEYRKEITLTTPEAVQQFLDIAYNQDPSKRLH